MMGQGYQDAKKQHSALRNTNLSEIFKDIRTQKLIKISFLNFVNFIGRLKELKYFFLFFKYGDVKNNFPIHAVWHHSYAEYTEL